MKKTKQILMSVLALVALSGGGFWLYSNNQDNKVDTSSESIQQVAEKKSDIVISEDGKTVSYDGQTGKTALEILKAGTEVKTESSSYGDFVSGINGLDADSSKNYWSFYVNGEYASEGAGTYKTTDGEKIEWRLEDL